MNTEKSRTAADQSGKSETMPRKFVEADRVCRKLTEWCEEVEM